MPSLIRGALSALVTGGLLALPACGNSPAGCAPVGSGDLFYTRYSGEPNLKKVHYSYQGGKLTLGKPQAIATLSGVDGVAWAPDGDLLVGSQGENVHKVKVSNGKSTDAKSGGAAAFHVVVDPGGKKVYVTAIPGVVGELQLSPWGKGVTHAVKGDDPGVTTIAFDGSGNAFYTSSGAGGVGTFGQINLATFTTKRSLESQPGMHGMAFDSYTGDLVTFGANRILQIDPKTRKIVSQLQVQGASSLDQGTVNGHGYIYVADNNGQLVFVDYSRSRKVGDTKNVVITTPLDSGLDDVAPVSGPGSEPCK